MLDNLVLLVVEMLNNDLSSKLYLYNGVVARMAQCFWDESKGSAVSILKD